MILDKRTQLCTATTVATGGTAGFVYNLGDTIDTQTVLRDLGNGEPLYCVAVVTTAITSNVGAGTVVFRLVSDDQDPPAATANGPTTNIVSATFATATTAGATGLPAGTVIFAQQLPIGSYERYLGFQQITGTGTNTLAAGAVSVFLTKDYTAWRSYADGVTQNV